MRTRRLLSALLVVSLSACATSTPSGGGGKTPAVSGSFFSLSTGNADRLAAWYSDNLGFSIDRKGVTPTGVSFAILSRAEALIEILQLPTSKPRDVWGVPSEPEAIHGILKVGLLVRDLDSLYSRAQARHLDIFFPPVQPPDVPMRTFGLKDPDGNIVQFFGP